MQIYFGLSGIISLANNTVNTDSICGSCSLCEVYI